MDAELIEKESTPAEDVAVVATDVAVVVNDVAVVYDVAAADEENNVEEHQQEQETSFLVVPTGVPRLSSTSPLFTRPAFAKGAQNVLVSNILTRRRGQQLPKEFIPDFSIFSVISLTRLGFFFMDSLTRLGFV